MHHTAPSGTAVPAVPVFPDRYTGDTFALYDLTAVGVSGGHLFAVAPSDRRPGRHILLGVPQNADGSVTGNDLGEITNLFDEPDPIAVVVARINAALGTAFTVRDFPGR